jgi:hypothetical protein
MKALKKTEISGVILGIVVAIIVFLISHKALGSICIFIIILLITQFIALIIIMKGLLKMRKNLKVLLADNY